MAFWTLDGHLVVDADGHPIECDTCPCTGAVVCCAGGPTYDALYLWGYFSTGSGLPGTPWCLSPDCTGTTFGANAGTGSGPFYRSYGVFSGGPVTWNKGDYSITGTIGCANVRLSASCLSAVFGFFEADFGAGYQPGTGFPSETDVGSGCPVPTLGCFFGDTSGGYVGPAASMYLTDRDPATGILCPDGSIVPTTFSVNLMLGLTTYTCTMVFAGANGGYDDGSTGCYKWLGYLVDCSSADFCHLIVMEYIDISGYNGGSVSFPPSTLGWALVGLFGAVGITSTCRFYLDVPLPNSGNAIDDWDACSGVPNPNPMWSIT